MNRIHLPSLRGAFGNWNYFCTIIKAKDAIENNRIITVPESKELYTKNINQVLQREIDNPRTKKIRDYLLKNKERFFSSLIIAIHKGNPKWADFDIETRFRVDNELVNDKDVEFIENKIGILTLTGNEEMFVLDGQHRLVGLREAFKVNKKVGNDELCIMLIVHKSDLKERTRRLFTVLNRYAVSIKPAEKVILEEDDAAAILTRRLVQKYKIFKLDSAISTTKQFSLSPTDTSNFTSLVCLYEISKVLIDYSKLYKSRVIIRPTDRVLNSLYDRIISFWTFFFIEFPEVVRFINGQRVSSRFKRNNKTGGSLLLRPEGQKLFAEVYHSYEKQNKLRRFQRGIRKIDFNLNGYIWKYVFWRGDKMETKHKKLKKALFLYMLNDYHNVAYINKELTKIYKEYNIRYKKNIKPVIV